MSEFPTPIHDLPAGLGGRFVVLVAVFVVVLWGLLTLFVPNYNYGYGTDIFIGSISIALAILVNSLLDRFSDKGDED